jgi:chromosomal replication initiator protein
MSDLASVAAIKQAVCLEFGVTLADLSVRQTKPTQVSMARQVAMYLARQISNEKVDVLAMDFGLRDHSTVVVSVKRITVRMATDPFLRLRVRALKAKLQSELVEEY